MKNDTAQTVRMMTTGQMKDLCVAAVQGIPTDGSFEVADDVLGRKTDFIVHIRSFFPNPVDLVDPVKVWQAFYLKYLGLVVDLSGVKIPERTAMQAKEFTRLIIVASGLTQNQVYDACHCTFNGRCWRYADDLNTAIPKNERDPKNGAYAIWVRDTVEADEVHKNKSAKMVAQEGLKTETSLERMLHELKYFAETGKHLDIVNVTLCSGSRNADGFVPYAYWYVKFRVGWYNLDYRLVYLRPREVVS